MADETIVFGTGKLRTDDTGALYTVGGGGGSDATAANQDEQTALLTTIDADTGGIALGVGGTADAVVAAGATGSLSAKLRRVTQGLEDLKSLIVLAAGELHIGAVGGHTANPASTQFTRPADTTAYASGDLVANNTTAGSVAPLQFTVTRIATGSGSIRRARMKKSTASITSAAFRLHLYSASPTPSNGDNGVWLSTGAATYLGSLDITFDRAFTDGATGNGTPSVGSEITFKLASGSIIYGLIEARSAYTPGNAETFDVTLEVFQD